MSEYVFKLPDLGEGTVESEIAEWFVKVGDRVAEEDVVATMMTDKAAIEVSSPVAGSVVRLAGEPGDIVAVGAPLVVFETDGDTATAAEPVAAGSAATAAEPVVAPADESIRVMTSPAIRRRAKEAGIDLAQVPGTGPGGRILRKDFDRWLAGNGANIVAAARPAVSARRR